MIPPIFQYARNSTAVTALLGTTVTRFWPFGSARQPGEPGYGLPYAVWQIVYGTPTNYVNQLPDSDNAGIQVDAYGEEVDSARAVMIALRDAFEPHGYVTAYNGEDRDAATGLYRASFTVEFWTDRGT